MSTHHCAVCGESVALDTSEVVAAAQIIAFADAHDEHHRILVEFQNA